MIAVLGLGNMGGAIARRLNGRFDVVGFDLSPEAITRANDAGLTTAASLPDAVSSASTVLTSLPNDDIVTAAWLDDGILDHAQPGTVLIELSTIMPSTMTRIGEKASSRGFAVVDSPVSGGPGEAEIGKLGMLVGGDDETVESVTEILAQIGTIKRTGPIGTGKVVKIVNNMMSMANVLAASEAFSLGVAAGVEPRRLYDVLAGSGGSSQHFTKRWPKALDGNFDPGFTISLGEKDLALGVDLAREMHMPSPVASTGREMYHMAMMQGYAERDIVALLKFYQGWRSDT